MALTAVQFHEISESRHRIINPFTEEKLDLVARVCGLSPGTRLLDLACGKGEMLCRWARDHGVTGVGVDISEVFLNDARERAAELGVAGALEFELGDAAAYDAETGGFDVVSCVGATWIGDGLAGTIKLLRPALREGGLMLIGEPYWISPPPPEAGEALEVELSLFGSLAQTLDRFENAGMDLLEMVLADQDSWDRYAAAQWWALSDWLRAHPGDPHEAEVRAGLTRSRRSYLEYARHYMGWGVFVLRALG